MRKSVAFFVTSVNSGGIENYLLRFLRFSGNRFNVLVICKGGILGDLKEKYEELGNVTLIPIKIGYFDIFSYIKVYRILNVAKVSTVCDFTGNFAGIILYISKLLKIKTRISFYRGATNHFRETKGRLLYNKFVKKLVFNSATKILSNSQAALDFFYPERGINDNRFKVIYNGVYKNDFCQEFNKLQIKEELDLPKESFVIGHTGRYNSAKNHITIANVALNLCKKYHDIYFLICGKGTGLFKKEIINKYPELESRLISFGYREDVNKILKSLDLYFFPSLTEGQPNALIEAQISGLPIIASNIEPIIETTPPELHQFLRTPTDVEGFTFLIEKCYLDGEFRKSLNNINWAISKFDPNKLFEEFLNEIIYI